MLLHVMLFPWSLDRVRDCPTVHPKNVPLADSPLRCGWYAHG